MKKRSIKSFCELLLLITISNCAFAQHKVAASLLAFQELSKVRQVFVHLPLQVNIHIRNTAQPFTSSNDTLHSDVSFYWGKPGLYMQADGLEEIANDSLIIMVNNDAKQVSIYPGNPQLLQKAQTGFAGILGDSTLQWLTAKYRSYIQTLDGSREKIVLTSRENVFGTQFPKETVTLLYHASTYEASEFSQTKLSLLPLDSSVYIQLAKDPAYASKLVSASTGKGQVFLLVKSFNTTYTFKNISYAVQQPPVKEQDRIVKDKYGNYVPAKGFEEYILSKEF